MAIKKFEEAADGVCFYFCLVLMTASLPPALICSFSCLLRFRFTLISMFLVLFFSVSVSVSSFVSISNMSP